MNKISMADVVLPCAGRDLVNMAKKRPNVIPIIEDARHPARYRMLLPMVRLCWPISSQQHGRPAKKWPAH